MSMFDMALFLLLVALAALLVRCFYSISDLRDSNHAIKRVLERQMRINDGANKIMHNLQEQTTLLAQEVTLLAGELEGNREDSHEQ